MCFFEDGKHGRLDFSLEYFRAISFQFKCIYSKFSKFNDKIWFSVIRFFYLRTLLNSYSVQGAFSSEYCSVLKMPQK